MAGIKISNLPAASSALLTDVFPVDQLPGPVTYKETNAQLLTLFRANGAALTSVDDTNVTMTLVGAPSISLLNATSMTLGWTGTLSPARGGTGVNNASKTLTLGGNLATSGAFSSTFTMTAATSVTFPTSGTLATTSQIPSGAALTKVDDTNVTLTLGGSPTTALVNAASLTLGWSGQLSVPRGGTGISSFGTGVATALGQNVTGSGGIVLSTAPTLTQITFSSTSGIIGTTTNNNAAALSVGELLQADNIASPVTLSSGVTANVTSLSLTAGDWDVYPSCVITQGTALTLASFALSLTSATLPDLALRATLYQPATFTYFGGSAPMLRVSIASPTTVYLAAIALDVNATAKGQIQARRRR